MSLRALAHGALLAAALAAAARAAPAGELIVDGASPDLASFERLAARARELGATHVVVTNDLPPAQWEFDTPGDPYPAWYAFRPGLLKVFPPPEVKPCVDAGYAAAVGKVLEQRCAILRKYGLRGAWTANEPQVMPEAFFSAYPELRGPRVDQPNRSRTPRFAPCTDQPETLRLYREAMQELVRRCPVIDSFNFLTTDSGSGFCWVPGLYPGQNGPAACRDRPMAERVSGFLLALQEAGRDAGHPVEIAIRQEVPRQWMEPSFAHPMEIIQRLPRGLALDNREGPDGRAYSGPAAASLGGGAWYPLVGIAFPSTAWNEERGNPPRRILALGDPAAQDFNARLYLATRDRHPRNALEHLAMLRDFAASLAGEARADDLLDAWLALNAAQDGLNQLNFGPVFRMGDVLARWVTRPLVPFPDRLDPKEKSFWRPYLFQAKGEREADDLADIQAMRMYEGWGAHLLFQRVVETTAPHLEEAVRRIDRVAASADPASRPSWELLSLRLQAALCLLHGADHAVAYQAQLDRVNALGAKPEPDPVLGTASSWDRTDLQRTARDELDNTVRLWRLLQRAPGPIFDLAPAGQGESIMRLGADLPAELKRKIDVMNAHWGDYAGLFTQPNP